MTGRELLNIVLSEGVVVKEEHDDLVKEFDKALEENRIYWIPKDGKTIGFCTYEKRDNRVLINKCVIYKQFRDRFSLISLCNYFRSLFKDVDYFYWINKRRGNRICRCR